MGMLILSDKELKSIVGGGSVEQTIDRIVIGASKSKENPLIGKYIIGFRIADYHYEQFTLDKAMFNYLAIVWGNGVPPELKSKLNQLGYDGKAGTLVQVKTVLNAAKDLGHGDYVFDWG